MLGGEGSSVPSSTAAAQPIRRRWQRKVPEDEKLVSTDGACGTTAHGLEERAPAAPRPLAQGPATSADGRSRPACSVGSGEGLSRQSQSGPGSRSGSVIWLLGRQGLEMSLPDGALRKFELPFEVKAGSRVVQDPREPDSAFVLENGSSRLWWLHVRTGSMQDVARGQEGARFRSSLGSRFLFCQALGPALIVTGTPGKGAHTPWLFDLVRGSWRSLPDAPFPILSSAGAVEGGTLVIAGGWSKEQSCHGQVQALELGPQMAWKVTSSRPLPWRRPGAGRIIDGRFVIAMGWIEAQGEVGTPAFHLLRRNGGAQRASTSSSRLVASQQDGSVVELAVMPLADSFEHGGEIFLAGQELFCVGRDHVQSYDAGHNSWKSWRLPRELANDSSSSWTKHCGSWAMTWLSPSRPC